MATRLPTSQRTHEALTALIDGRLSTASAKDELVTLATRLTVEEATSSRQYADLPSDRLLRAIRRMKWKPELKAFRS